MSAFVNLISRFDDKGLRQADTGLKTTGQKLKNFGKIAGAAFATAGAAAVIYAGKLLVDGVKSAVEDEAAQAKLAKTLQNVTGATNKQISAVEDYVTKTSLQYGITDDKLRPSLEKLAIATGDITKAQKLQTLAMDVAAGTGKDLDAVSLALAKAYNGNLSGLTRLGIKLDENIIKNKDFDTAQKELTKTFGGQASTAADTFAGKMARLQIGFNEMLETVGSFILDALVPLGDWIVKNIIPGFQKLGDGLGKKLVPIMAQLGDFIKKDFIPAVQEMAKWFQEKVIPIIVRAAKVVNDTILPAFRWFANFIIDYIVPAARDLLLPAIDAIIGAFEKISKTIQENKSNFEPLIKVIEFLAGFIRDTLAPILGGILGKAFELLGIGISKAIEALGFILKAGQKVWDFFGGIKEGLANAFNGVADIIFKPFKMAFNWIADRWNSTIGSVSFKTPDWLPGDPMEWSFPKIPKLANGGIVTEPTLALIGEAGPEAVVPLNRRNQAASINITINGAIDPEGTARQIRQILRRSELRAGAF